MAYVTYETPRSNNLKGGRPYPALSFYKVAYVFWEELALNYITCFIF